MYSRKQALSPGKRRSANCLTASAAWPQPSHIPAPKPHLEPPADHSGGRFATCFSVLSALLSACLDSAGLGADRYAELSSPLPEVTGCIEITSNSRAFLSSSGIRRIIRSFFILYSPSWPTASSAPCFVSLGRMWY